ncbi:hypothetical protein IHE44_0013712, partial [Lamprotornis superbus]
PPGKTPPTLSATPTLNTCKDKIQHGLVEYTAPSAGWRMEHIPPENTFWLIAEKLWNHSAFDTNGVFKENNIDGCERAAGLSYEMEINHLNQSEEALCLLHSGNISRGRSAIQVVYVLATQHTMNREVKDYPFQRLSLTGGSRDQREQSKSSRQADQGEENTLARFSGLKRISPMGMLLLGVSWLLLVSVVISLGQAVDTEVEHSHQQAQWERGLHHSSQILHGQRAKEYQLPLSLGVLVKVSNFTADLICKYTTCQNTKPSIMRSPVSDYLQDFITVVPKLWHCSSAGMGNTNLLKYITEDFSPCKYN